MSFSNLVKILVKTVEKKQRKKTFPRKFLQTGVEMIMDYFQ